MWLATSSLPRRLGRTPAPHLGPNFYGIHPWSNARDDINVYKIENEFGRAQHLGRTSMVFTQSSIWEAFNLSSHLFCYSWRQTFKIIVIIVTESRHHNEGNIYSAHHLVKLSQIVEKTSLIKPLISLWLL